MKTKIDKKLVWYTDEFLHEFQKSYGYIYWQDYLTKEDVSNFLEDMIDDSLDRQMNMFQDYVLSQGLCDVVE